ncbi:MAG: hypothetical protein LAQ30_21115 [Acidobacteriia bacterium]|nr:hypothetical protein [Terriglobia bacterium]
MVSWKRVATVSVCLLAVNVWIAWRLFTSEYLNEMSSLAGIYIGMARYLAAHWPHVGWWPLWFCGMPFANVYPPGLHVTVAAFAALSGFDAARAYHFVTGAAYCLGPVTLFWLVTRLTRSAWTGACAGLLYSVASPAAWLVGPVRHDLGGALFANRLRAMAVYADSPNVAGLTLVPLAILALDWAVERRTFGSFVLAACAFAAVPLTNIPAAMALAFAVVAYLLAYGTAASWTGRTGTAAGAAVLGYLLIAPALPPSTVWNMLVRTQQMEPENAFAPRHWAMLAAVAALTAALRWLLGRARAPRALRFFALLSLFMGAVTLGKYWLGVTMLAQPTRFQHVMEMGLIGSAAVGAAWLIGERRRLRFAAVAALALFCAFGAYDFRAFAKRTLLRIDITKTSEYKIARWLDRHPGGGRAFLLGSSAFWLNAFGDTPQVAGCCLQGMLQNAGRYAHYEVGSDDGAGDRAFEVSMAWLQALGVSRIAVTGPGSTDAYKDYHHPWKFEGRLPELWRGGDDAIYEVPQRAPGLAHVVLPEELTARFPEDGIDIKALAPYVAALEDPGKPLLEERWNSPSEAVLRGSLSPRDVISVQVSYHPGWHATAAGARLPVSADALGFLTIAPRCSGDCAVRLFYDGGAEMRLLKWLWALTVALVVVWGCRRLSRARRKGV